MCDCKLTPEMNRSVRSIVPFDISDLKCEALMKLFQETTSYIQDIRIEMMASRRSYREQEEHPATTLGITVQRPTIRFADSLIRERRIDTIAHELVHILLVYRFGLRMIERRIHHPASNQDIFDYFLNLNRFWDYFLSQTVNTVHHRILIGYLKEEYGIASDLYLTLFRHNFRILSKSHYPDRESQYAKGVAAFEYEKLVGKIDMAIDLYRQSEFFWKAYSSAQEHFENYDFQAIPTASTYEENVLSFLEDLGYQKHDFTFLPETALEGIA